jgi:hypothetical protein
MGDLAARNRAHVGGAQRGHRYGFSVQGHEFNPITARSVNHDNRSHVPTFQAILREVMGQHGKFMFFSMTNSFFKLTTDEDGFGRIYADGKNVCRERTGGFLPCLRHWGFLDGYPGFRSQQTLASSGANIFRPSGALLSSVLLASRILPWGNSRRNGQIRRTGCVWRRIWTGAFDCGLIGIDGQNRVMVSAASKRYLPNDAIESEFMRREGQALVRPERFAPEQEFFAYHRRRILRH